MSVNAHRTRDAVHDVDRGGEGVDGCRLLKEKDYQFGMDKSFLEACFVINLLGIQSLMIAAARCAGGTFCREQL